MFPATFLLFGAFEYLAFGFVPTLLGALLLTVVLTGSILTTNFSLVCVVLVVGFIGVEIGRCVETLVCL